MSHGLLRVLVLGALLGAAAAAERVVLDLRFADVADPAACPIAEDEWKKPQGLLTLAEEGGVRHLAVRVPSSVQPILRQHFPVRKDKVYRIELTGRGEGQVEYLGMQFRRRGGEYAWYGGTGWPVTREWATQSVQIKPPLDDANGCIWLDLKGVGTYDIRSLRVSECDGWQVPAAPPPRGELLVDGAFRLGGLGWHYTNPGWGGAAQAYAAAGRPAPWTPRSAAPGADFTPRPGIFAFLCPLANERFHIGRTYEFTLRGQAADDDLQVAVVRSGVQWDQVYKGGCRFRDGVATCRFTMGLPASGALAERADPCGIVLEYHGGATARIAAVSLRELADGEAAAASPPPPAVGLELRGIGRDPLGHVAVHGEALRARVRAIGLPAGPCPVEIRPAGAEPGLVTVELAAQADGSLAGDLPLDRLGCGYYRITPRPPAPALALPEVCAVVPPPLANAAADFLGAHFESDDPRQIACGALAGLRTARCFEFGWQGLEAKTGEFAFPEGRLAAYLGAGVEPMVLLNGSPRWASSAPDDLLQKPDGWSSYPPRLDSQWRAYVERMAALLKGRVHVWQIWNEPNGYFLKTNPRYHPSLEEAYVGLVKTANAAIKAADPQAIVVAGATAGLAPEFHRRCIELGILDHCDAISYHAYGECSSAGQGAAVFRGAVGTLAGLMHARGQVKPIWDCESGFAIPEGLDGCDGAQLLLEGLVAEKAAGIARHYIYSAYPKRLPSESNFNMILGYGGRPLASVPAVALFDRLLSGAAFAADLGDDAEGIHAYAFTRGDGATVAVGWTTTTEPRQTVACPALADAVACDAWGGRASGAVADGRLILWREPRWFVPPALATAVLGR